jgi:hypothetical protein
MTVAGEKSREIPTKLISISSCTSHPEGDEEGDLSAD